MAKKEQMAVLFKRQKTFFASNQTQPLSFRLEQLKKLREMLKRNEEKITQALYLDLGKHPLESYATEIGFVLHEIRVMEKKLRSWSKAKKVATPFYLWPSTSSIIYEPYGTVLIIGPFNYPFQLLFMPLIGAIAAGNTAIVKPSELTPNTSHLISQMIAATFSASYIASVEGGVKTNQELLTYDFDYIFFTGSQRVGKIVMKKAAEHLTPVTLELGGKSPAFVTQNADLKLAARRIIYGKMINAGQTCVAPDYVCIDERVKAAFIRECLQVLQDFYGHRAQASSSYPRIVNQQHFERLTDLLQVSEKEIIYGGQTDRNDRYIQPTLLDSQWQSAIMKAEIFGPILPLVSYKSLKTAISASQKLGKPLALYIFSKNKKEQKQLLQSISSGGVGINNTVLQLAADHLPFGGVGEAGMGNYHGKYSFLTFSHERGILTARKMDTPFIAPPYTKKHLKWLRKILR